MKNLLSNDALIHLYNVDPLSARALESAGDLTPPRRAQRRAPRPVIDNRRLLAIIMQQWQEPDEPAADEEVIEGEWTEV